MMMKTGDLGISANIIRYLLVIINGFFIVSLQDLMVHDCSLGLHVSLRFNTAWPADLADIYAS